MQTVAAFLETLCPADLLNLAPGRQRYTQLLNDDGGIVDDLMVTRPPGADGALRLSSTRRERPSTSRLIRRRMPSRLRLTPLAEAALIALQGPWRPRHWRASLPAEGLETMPFMSARPARIAEFEIFVSRSGYTGEDGYEVSLASTLAENFARILLTEPDVAPIGLGAQRFARGSRLASAFTGTNLTRPSIRSRRLWPGRFRSAGASMADFPAPGASRTRWRMGRTVSASGVRPDGRAPAREGAKIASPDGAPIGVVTSGGFGPSVGASDRDGLSSRAITR